MHTLDEIEICYGDFGEEKTCSLSDFLALKNLQYGEEKLQRALKILHNLDKKHHLFKEGFPEHNGQRLLISAQFIVDLENESLKGEYDAEAHQIEVYERNETPEYLALTLGHELKHAQQMTDEMRALKNNPKTNNLQHHQLQFLQEAQAFAFADRIACLLRLPEGNHYATAACIGLVYGEDSEEDIERELMKSHLLRLYNSTYKDEYDKNRPLLLTDEGLTTFPTVFHVNEKLKKTLDKVPRQARTMPNAIRHIFHNAMVDKLGDLLLAKSKTGEPMITQKGIQKFCMELYHSGKETDVSIATAILTAKNPDGTYIADKETMQAILSDSVKVHYLDKMRPLFSESDKNGKKRISSASFQELLTSVREKKDPFLSLISSISPKKSQKDLAILEQLGKEYYGMDSRAFTPAPKKGTER